MSIVDPMEPLSIFFMVSDFVLATFFVGLVYWLYNNGKIPISYLYAFWLGTLIGSTWEFTFLFLGPEFLHGAVDWPWGLDGWPRKVSHSIWDGAIFMFGVYLCHLLLDGELFQRFESKELGIMWGWGLSQELLVEYLFNGRVWIYEPLSWNPVIIPTIPGSAPMSPGYTLIPQAVWVIAPILFYFGFLFLCQRHPPQE
ncbi:MAG: hypothetical protein P8Q90_03575 [Candidatus Thalassarchaeaceae archaeon]|nr:hypothetical protein [Candidatus Thalassarchaeaceae archaeon]